MLDIGVQIAFARKKRNLSQTDLAKMTGLKPSAISHFECGRRTPTLMNVFKIANALRISLDELFNWGYTRESEGNDE